ncbi:nitrate- and nitrite sensing domain-containing protein [Actinoplanes octamycinicus]|nr:histidine kinase [Actinoplanes octamycinicus]
MVAVPLAALLALWVFATAATAGPALDLLASRDVVLRMGDPGLQLIAQLQRERHFSAVYLAAPRTPGTELKTQRAATDAAIADFRAATDGLDMSDDLRDRVATLFHDIDALPGIRARIDAREIRLLEMVNTYNDVVDAGFDVSTTAAVFFHEKVDREVRGLITGYRGLEFLSRVDATLAGANASGKVDAPTRGKLIEDVATSRYLLRAGVADMPEKARGDYAQLITRGSTFVTLDVLQSELITKNYTGQAPPVKGTEWQPVFDQVSAELRAFELRTVDEVVADATPLAVRVFLWLGLAALLGLVAFLLAIWVSVRVGRSIVGRLIKLRREALEMASERLPTVVGRLQRGEAVDVDVETPPLDYGMDEIGQLGQAFNDVQRTAVQSAVDEANVRRGINEVFLNIARRSQTLLHRQLSLLDKMERRETEPQELEDLYRVDHLATRMRRHAEDLVILAGAAPGRGWRNPVPVIDVVRGAISEVEDYKRVDIRAVAASALYGRAVGDVIHLLAELIENAASFSPPHTRVQVSGQVLPSGYAIEVEDRGLGMTPEALEQANRRLAEPPEFDPADSARLGLFVVAQLATRHHIRVSLQASPYGGVTAVVLLPGDLVTEAPSPAGTGSRANLKPLVGSGQDEPAKPSLAALQWSGEGELQQVPAVPRQRTSNENLPALNGSAGEPGGPTPSAIASELSPDGLVQRKRVRRTPQVPPAELPPAATAGQLDDVAGALGGSRAVPRNSAPLASMPPAVPPPASPPPAIPSVPIGDEPTVQLEPDGLPKRVRQASLAPQLRHPVVEPESTAPQRSPEQVRTLMSALQLGTTRGRIQASKEAAVTGAGGDAAGDRAASPGGNESNRPEKDA